MDIRVAPGSHASEDAGTPCLHLPPALCRLAFIVLIRLFFTVNKQLNDKERVAAALENAHLVDVVNTCIAQTD